MDKKAKSRPVDPILNLPVKSEVTSLCFVSRKNSALSSAESDQPTKVCSDERHHLTESTNCDGSDSSNSVKDDSDDDSDDEIDFRSSTIRVPRTEEPASFSKNSSRVLTDRLLASCHSDGEALLWDLKNQRRVATLSPPRGGPGICIRRTDDPSRIMFQTRDPKGIVSLHSIEHCDSGGPSNGTKVCSVPTRSTAIRQYETHSRTFCRAAPCHGNQHLLALPNIDHSAVTVTDVRSAEMVAEYCIENHGMVTSLAFSVTENCAGNDNGRPILACGMESGTTVLFDITNGSTKSLHEASFSIGKDPILALDLLPSRATSPSGASMLVAAGMAGDAQDVSQLSEDERGRAVLFQTDYGRDDDNASAWSFQQRARLSTCRVDSQSYNGKPGVSVCRFRPGDGRLLAIGGWDKRIRLFEQSKGKLVALLKGSTGSIADVDWAPDSISSGLLASADKDNKLITLWQCFEKIQ